MRSSQLTNPFFAQLICELNMHKLSCLYSFDLYFEGTPVFDDHRIAVFVPLNTRLISDDDYLGVDVKKQKGKRKNGKEGTLQTANG